jgi:hypothetical protein
MRGVAFLVALSLVGCKKPEKDPIEQRVAASEDEFSSTDWENLTEELVVAGREGNVEAFKANVHPDTQKMFEESWARITKRIEEGLGSGQVKEDDRLKLEKLREGCTWKGLGANYTPGRLVTITPKDADTYMVREMLAGGRKVDYLVVRDGERWVVKYENDARWFRQLEALAYAAVNTILERNGVGECSGATCGAPEKAGAEIPAEGDEGQPEEGAEGQPAEGVTE